MFMYSIWWQIVRWKNTPKYRVKTKHSHTVWTTDDYSHFSTSVIATPRTPNSRGNIRWIFIGVLDMCTSTILVKLCIWLFPFLVQSDCIQNIGRISFQLFHLTGQTEHASVRQPMLLASLLTSLSACGIHFSDTSILAPAYHVPPFQSCARFSSDRPLLSLFLIPVLHAVRHTSMHTILLSILSVLKLRISIHDMYSVPS